MVPGLANAGISVTDTRRASADGYKMTFAVNCLAHARLIGDLVDAIGVSVFEPGFMPGTGLGRGHGAAALRIGRAIGRLPGVSTPARSGPQLASVVLDDRWADLRDGAYVVKDKPVEIQPSAHDRERERRLWDATAELLESAGPRD